MVIKKPLRAPMCGMVFNNFVCGRQMFSQGSDIGQAKANFVQAIVGHLKWLLKHANCTKGCKSVSDAQLRSLAGACRQLLTLMSNSETFEIVKFDTVRTRHTSNPASA